MKSITIDFDEHGKATIAVAGVAGKSCVSETAELETALGLRDATRTATREMYQQATAKEVQRGRA